MNEQHIKTSTKTLNKILKEYKNKAELSRKIGVTAQQLGRWFDGPDKIPFKHAYTLSKIHNLDITLLRPDLVKEIKQ